MYSTGCYGIDERGVIALVLIGIRLGKGRDCAVEDLGGAEVAGDLDGIARSRVGAGPQLYRAARISDNISAMRAATHVASLAGTRT